MFIERKIFYFYYRSTPEPNLIDIFIFSVMIINIESYITLI